ncbi:MAG: HupE/UreJ family protein [Cytophagales bacterium]|nr:HupE/UreJ family protein [Cytophagales bacterium]
MSAFELYFGLGLDHILDLNGYDHILFVIALSCVYSLQQWKGVLGMITAFTIGHSITLALATFDIIPLDSALVEFLIPVTIVITAVSNLFTSSEEKSGKWKVNIYYAGFFGLIHGMGFSNYLRSLLGGEESIVLPLFAFNIALEVGQIIIVAIFLIITLILTRVFSVPSRIWKIIVSLVVAAVGVSLALDAVYW